jgi:23S rRNA (cytidine1920-2'-O)/16S rRNA (cytidine1409-2'-O)-methyltransferase
MKPRLDQALVARGLAETRTKAQGLIMAGLVFVRGKRADKPGVAVAEDAAIEVKGKEHPYVSRGGVKLAHALGRFGIDPKGKICLDIGASTGGFTDVLLRRGAAKVYAVDVGHGQLDWSLRNDPRVVVLEKVNARHLTPAEVPEPADLVVCDASFIGLMTVLPAPLSLAAPGVEPWPGARSAPMICRAAPRRWRGKIKTRRKPCDPTRPPAPKPGRD